MSVAIGADGPRNLSTSSGSDTRVIDIYKAADDPLLVDWASEHIAALPVIYRAQMRGSSVWRSLDGYEWRDAGSVVVSPGIRIAINLRADATDEDARFLEHRVKDAREGRLTAAHGWERYTHDGIDRWCFRMARYIGRTGLIARARDELLGAPIVLCTDEACESNWHATYFGPDDVWHEVAPVAPPWEQGGAVLTRKDDEVEWKIELAGEESMTVAQARVLRAHLDLVIGEADWLNAGRRLRSRATSSPRAVADQLWTLTR